MPSNTAQYPIVMEGLNIDLNRQYDPNDTMHCCCGRPDCAVLKKNSSVLEIVEKDVQTAAQLGKALLARHEAYMADAERDRIDLTTRIERLEMDKSNLEAENALQIEENRQLLNQLELLNSTISDSDTKIKSLEASLLSSQQAIRRLEGAAARAEDAERHLAMMEEEQDQLFSELRTTREDSRSHAQRFKEAQRGIVDMQDQLERMEQEAIQERERHVQVINRMERQREVEKQLDTAAGRLKGAAAAAKSMNTQKNGNSQVVGHFVRDLLQDNASLQLGIAELREMLLNSNDEIQSLRDQLTYHQPSQDLATTLKAELEPQLSPTHTRRLSQELHIHHHYHVTHKQNKPKKKRHSLNPGIFSATSGTTTPTGHMSFPSSPTAPALLSYMEKGRNVSSPLAEKGTWTGNTANSDIAASSVPSSPHSNRVSSLFDGGISDFNAPTSPTTSFDPMSPTWRASHHKRTSTASFQSFQTIPHLDIMSDANTVAQNSQRNYYTNVIQEVDEDAPQDDAPGLMGNATSTDDSTTEVSEISKDDGLPRPRLHRSLSHESIMSLSGGLDIHTLKARPSQMTLRPLGGLEAVVTGVTAQPTLSRTPTKRGDYFSGYQSLRSVSGSAADIQSSSPASSSSVLSTGITKIVAWRPWGSGGNSSSAKAPDISSPTPAVKEKKVAKRPAGINQAGAIPGFQEYLTAQKRRGAPPVVSVKPVDQESLGEALSDTASRTTTETQQS